MEWSTSNIVPAMVLTTLAGLSTAVGGLVVICFGKPSFVKLGMGLKPAAALPLTAKTDQGICCPLVLE